MLGWKTTGDPCKLLLDASNPSGSPAPPPLWYSCHNDLPRPQRVLIYLLGAHPHNYPDFMNGVNIWR